MKTNVVMVRKLESMAVHQRTSDGYFNATTFLAQWNETNGTGKAIPDFLRNDNVRQFMAEIMRQEDMENSPYVTSKARSDRGGGTWMHPLLFIDFAMWLSPTFKYHVLKFIYDQLIEYRHQAGDLYKGLTFQLKRKFTDPDYVGVAIAINKAVFGKHEPGIRQGATEEQLRQLSDLEKQLAYVLEKDLIGSQSEIIKLISPNPQTHDYERNA